MTKLVALFLLVTVNITNAKCQSQESLPKSKKAITTKDMKIKIIKDGKELKATLQDNSTSKDFYALLPLTLKIDDFASSEKIAPLPEKLSIYGAPKGYEGKSGDITYYAPWGNLAIFYKHSTAGYASGLVYMGKIEGDINVLTTGSNEIRIDKL